MRLTLVTLAILRAPLMVRTAAALLLTAAFVLSAGAVRVTTPEKPHAHASGGKGAAHSTQRAHSKSRHASHPAHSSAAHSSRSAKTGSVRHKTGTGSHATIKAQQMRAAPTTTQPQSAPKLQMAPTWTASPETLARAKALGLAPSPEGAVPPENPVPATAGPLAASTEESAPEEASLTASPKPLDPPVDTVNRFDELFNPTDTTQKLGKYTLRGNRDSLVRQNERSEADDLERIEDDTDLADRIARGMLVPVPVSASLAVNPALPEDRRYCRPWTAAFLTDLARAHDAQFHKPLMVSSAVRTVEYQRHLMRRNHNAAAAEGDIVSPHLTGATIDIAKSGLNRHELNWMRNKLLFLQNQGLIDVEEEYRQACFHITVYREYAPDEPSLPTTKLAADATDQPAGSEAVSNHQ